MSVPLALRIGPCSPAADIVALLRAAAGAPLSVIVESLKTGAPLPICSLFGLDHDEKEKMAFSLFAELVERGAKFEIVFRGQIETMEVFRNLVETYHQIAYDTRMEMELESGEPSDEALQWATGKFDYPNREG
ncbi:MAG: hypothetical protein V4858_25175 [Pseudomonadota bacterium]